MKSSWPERERTKDEWDAIRYAVTQQGGEWDSLAGCLTKHTTQPLSAVALVSFMNEPRAPAKPLRY